jgi:hypothetical protein
VSGEDALAVAVFADQKQRCCPHAATGTRSGGIGTPKWDLEEEQLVLSAAIACRLYEEGPGVNWGLVVLGWGPRVGW